jgi:uncharacterized protein (TIGR03435 family)
MNVVRAAIIRKERSGCARLIGLTMSLSTLLATMLVAQAPAEFDVASIKPNNLNDRIVTIKIGPGGKFTARGYTLQLLIQQAYGVLGFQISAGPSWLDSDRYDVSAKVTMEGNLTERQLRPLLQKLLAERFHLRVQQGAKEMAGYALTAARGGPKMQADDDGEEHPDTIRMSGIGFQGQGITTGMLASIVQSVLGFPVVDKTGLKGVYDIQVSWTEQYTRRLPDIDPGDTGRASEPAGSTIFTALNDRLGLKLSAQRVTVPTIIVEHAEKATEN